MVNRRIFAGAALIGVLTLFVKLAALAREVIVARRFGADDQLDAFLVALLVPSFIASIVGGSLPSALIPTYIRVRERHGPGAANRLAAFVLAYSIAGLSVLLSALLAASPYVLPLVATGFTPEKLALTQSLLEIMAGILVLCGISAVLASTLNSLERFALPALTPAAPALCAAAVLLARPRQGVHALAMGTLLGFAIEALLLAGAVAWRGTSLATRYEGLTSDLRFVLRQYWPTLAGAALLSSSNLIDQSMAAALGPGNVSVLNYGNKIVAVSIGLAAAGLSTAIFPHFSRLVALGQWDDIRQMLRTQTRWIALLTVPLMLLLIAISQPLVKLLFERGAFTPDTTGWVAQVQICYLLQLPWHALGIVGARLLSAMGSNQTLLWIGGVGLAVNIAGNYMLRAVFGVAGIAASTSLVYLITYAMIYWAIARRLAQVDASTNSRG